MMNRKFGVILFLMGIMVILVPRFILPVCEYQGYSPMACSRTAVAEMLSGAIVVAAAVGLFFLKSAESLRWLSLAALMTGASVILIPEAVGYCHSSRMPCNYGTIPVLRLLGVLIILLSLTGFFLSLKGKTGAGR
jgi:hypothetical protein